MQHNVGSPEVETPEIVRDRILATTRHIPVAQLGTTDDDGTYRDIAFPGLEKASRKATKDLRRYPTR